MKRIYLKIIYTFLIPVIILFCTPSNTICDSLDDFVAENLKNPDAYAKDVAEYIVKMRNNEKITESDSLRYSHAYAYYAYEYHRKNDSANAIKSASLAVSLSLKNYVALFVAGYICKLNGDYTNAVTCFRKASNIPDEKIKTNAHIELALIAAELINEANRLAEEELFLDAKERLVFLQKNTKTLTLPKLPRKN